MKKKLFIVFDGPEGGGKSTIIEKLRKYLQGQGYRVFTTKEPGGGDPVCVDIRKILLDPKHKGGFNKKTELFLFCGDRAQHIEEVVKPVLEDLNVYENTIVLCDRFEAVMYAYQYFTRGACTLDEFRLLNNYATGGLKPDFTFILDIDHKIGKMRNTKNGKKDRFEIEDPDFHNKAREGFKEYCRTELFPGTWMIVDASKNIEEVFEVIRDKFDELLRVRKAS
ncbi:dTMP kinase [Candidatus Wolfebacteria bacterium RIFCSPHIGHO2_01_FULL_48_22]|uniref:Thymidylate kinase n=2 Tax=Candidatus Wolfeibacteriota TaxID=1752735 RepID=A0A1F8DRC3_9BACT|nr:MAG: dTMP kinase [Candidatus Wolfebacteria bacterium RIFCSPHIGHO2_01_FULL_48_22]OGM92330.1 MAG: dTMP kinase [Candidatus Wolfebacteria bacterium RIFCSPLOWO2_01_FULL_47_17b]